MATGGVEVDSRVTCSVCLEPFRGRHPKILPCFHTFCLPCLSRLAKKETSRDDSEDNNGKSTASLSCPTCRSVIPVPPAGVADFQTNFYVDDTNKQSNTQPLPCNLCDGKQDASFQCDKCQKSFCSECRHYHDKLCLASQVRELKTECTVSSSLQGLEGITHSSISTVPQQLQKIEDVLKKLTERRKKINEERSTLENGINDRYATLLRHAGEAREACLASLRETCQGVSEGLQADIALVQQAQDTLTQQLSSPQPAPVSVPLLNAALFLDRDMQTILNADGDQKASVLHHEMKDDTDALISSIHSFMGRVVESGHIPSHDHTSSSSQEVGIQCNIRALAPAEPFSLPTETGDLQALSQRLEDLACQVTMLQSANTHSPQCVTDLGDNSSSKISTLEKELMAVKEKMSTDHEAVQREMASLKGENTKLKAEHAVLKREVTTLRDKNAIALQDVAVVNSEKEQLGAHTAKLQQDVISIQTDCSMLQSDVMQLKTDRDSVMATVTAVQTDTTALQEDITSAKNDIANLQADHTTVKSDMSTVLSDAKTLQGDSETAMKKISKLETDHSTVIVCDIIRNTATIRLQ